MSKYTATPSAGNVSSASAPVKSLAEILKPRGVSQGAELRTYNNTQLGQILSVSDSERIGLDTVHLTLSTTYAAIAPTFKAQISSIANTDGTYDDGPCILWTDTSGRPIYGNKAVINTDNWQLTILPCGDHANVLISTSAKAFAGTNVELMDSAQFRTVVKCIEAELRERGLSCDLMKDAHIRRLDIARNAEMAHGSTAYLGLFRNVPTTPRLRPSTDGDTYFRLGSAGWQAVIYDKGQEQAEKASKRKRKLPPTNSLRGEMRFLTSREVAKRFEVKKLAPAALLEPARFAQLPVMFRDVMRDSIFQTEKSPREYLSMNDETVKLWAEVQARIADMTEPGSAEYYRMVHHAMMAGAGGFDGARRWYQENCAADDTEAAKRRQRRFNQELKRAAELFGAADEESSGMTRDTLYNELRDAMLED